MSVKIHIITPYEAMLPLIEKCAYHIPGLQLTYEVGDLENGVKKAIIAESNGIDIIISRGGTARLIEKEVSIPIIDMKLSGYDILRTLTLAANLNEKTAFVGFPSITENALSIIDLLNLPIKIYTISGSDEVVPLIIQLKNEEYKQIIGDVVTCKNATIFGLNGLLLHSGEETILSAIEEAIDLHKNIKKVEGNKFILLEWMEKKYNNLFVTNGNKIIYRKLNDFDDIPINKKLIQQLKQNTLKNEGYFETHLNIEGKFIHVELTEIILDIEKYYVYSLETDKDTIKDIPGINFKSNTIEMDWLDNLTIINMQEDSIMKAINENLIIALIDEKKSGSSYYIRHVQKKYFNREQQIEINFEEIELVYLKDIKLENVGIVVFKNLSGLLMNNQIINFLSRVLENNSLPIFLFDSGVNDWMNQFDFIKINIPSIKENKSDFEKITIKYISHYHQKYGTLPVGIKNEAMQILFGTKRITKFEYLRMIIKESVMREETYTLTEVTVKDTIKQLSSDNRLPDPNNINIFGTLEEIEREIILKVVEDENFNQTKAAKRLGINRATLWRKLKDFNV